MGLDMNIGLLVIATNKYIKFVQPLITSADKFFLPNDEVTYFCLQIVLKIYKHPEK